VQLATTVVVCMVSLANYVQTVSVLLSQSIYCKGNICRLAVGNIHMLSAILSFDIQASQNAQLQIHVM